VHGDITPSNVALTSWGWLLLTDFASAYKPALLPGDNPAVFTFYYDTDGSRACTVAPERFVDTAASDGAASAASGCTPASDMFSAGAVLGALFTADGSPLCDLAALMAWRAGGADPRARTLSIIAADRALGPPVAALVERLTHKTPSQRMTAAEALATFDGVLWKPYYGVARAAAASALSVPDGDARASALAGALPELCSAVIASDATGDSYSVGLASRNGDQQEQQQQQAHMVTPGDMAAALRRAGTPPLPGAMLIGTLACASLACATRRSTKAHALHCMLTLAAPLCDDAQRAGRLLPYALALVNDRAAPLRAAAVAAAAQLILPMPPATAAWPTGAAALANLREVIHYVAPAISRAPTDSEECVRIAAARVMPHLIALAAQALDRAACADADAAATVDGVGSDMPALTLAAYSSYRASLAALLRETLSPDVLVAAPTSSNIAGGPTSPAAAAAALHSAVAAGEPFLVRAGSAEALLPCALACLNERLWRARVAAYEAAPALASSLGPAASHALASAAENGLHDAHPSVAAAAGRALARILHACAPHAGPLGQDSPHSSMAPALRRAALSAAVTAAPLRCHPGCGVRNAAARVLAAACDALGPVDTAALLCPAVAPFIGGTAAAARTELAYSGDKLTCSRILEAAPPPLTWMQWHALGVDGPTSEAAPPGGWPQGDAIIQALVRAAGASARRAASLQEHSGEGQSEGSVPPPPLYASSLVRGDAGSTSQLVTGPIAQALSPGVVSSLATAASLPLRATSASLPSPQQPSASSSPFVGIIASGMGGEEMTPWRPSGVLVAHYTEHRGRVNALAVCPSNAGDTILGGGGGGGGVSPIIPWVLSVSDDGSAKVWDVMPCSSSSPVAWGGALCGLRSCVTYSSQGGKLTSAAALSHDTVATGSDAGSVHIWRLDRAGTHALSRTTSNTGGVPSTGWVPSGAGGWTVSGVTPPAYTGATDIKRGTRLWIDGGSSSSIRDDGTGGGCTALAASPQGTPGVLLMASVTGGVKCWDTRSPGVAWQLPGLTAGGATDDGDSAPAFSPWKHERRSGAPTALVLDPWAGSWMVVGTSAGAVALWDLRFRVPLSTWWHPARAPVRTLALGAPHVRGGRPHLWVSCGKNGEVAALDAVQGVVTGVMRVRVPNDSDEPAAVGGGGGEEGASRPAGPQGTDPRDDEEDEDPLSSVRATLASAMCIRAIAPVGGGSLITAGDDASFRQWELLANAQRSTSQGCRTVVAPSHAPCLDGTPVVAAWRGVPVLQQRLRPSPSVSGRGTRTETQRRQDVDAHSDAITSLAVLPLAGGERLLFSASRDGVVKAWC